MKSCYNLFLTYFIARRQDEYTLKDIFMVKINSNASKNNFWKWVSEFVGYQRVSESKNYFEM